MGGGGEKNVVTFSDKMGAKVTTFGGGKHESRGGNRIWGAKHPRKMLVKMFSEGGKWRFKKS